MDDSAAALKASLRRDAVAARRALENKAGCSARIAQRLCSLPAFQNASALMTYVAKSDEVETRPIIERALHDGFPVFAPRIGNDDGMQWASITSLSDLVEGAFGVMEPSDATATPIPENAVALVPGVAFDRKGNRLGWGRGYFDRFLAEFRGPSIGLAFDCQIYEELPHEPHDQRVSCIVTESETIITRAQTSP